MNYTHPQFSVTDWNYLIHDVKNLESEVLHRLLNPNFFKDLETISGKRILVVEVRKGEGFEIVEDDINKHVIERVMPYLQQDPWNYDDLILRFT